MGVSKRPVRPWLAWALAGCVCTAAFVLLLPDPKVGLFEPRSLVEPSETAIRDALIELTRDLPGPAAELARASGTWCRPGYPPAMFLALVPSASVPDDRALRESFRSLESLGWTRFGDDAWTKQVASGSDGVLLTVHELDGRTDESEGGISYYGVIPKGMTAMASGGGLECRALQ